MSAAPIHIEYVGRIDSIDIKENIVIEAREGEIVEVVDIIFFKSFFQLYVLVLTVKGQVICLFEMVKGHELSLKRCPRVVIPFCFHTGKLIGSLLLVDVR